MAKDGDPQDELEDDINLDPPEDPADEDAADEPDEPDDHASEADEPGAPQDEPDSRTERRAEPREDRPPSRAERRISALQERLEASERRLQEVQSQVSRPVLPQGETPEQRAQRLALLTPTERMEEELRASEMRHNYALQTVMFQSQELADKTAFQAKVASDPVYRKWAPKVEAELARLRNHPDPQQRANVNREVLLAFMIGKAALDGRDSREGRQQRTQAERRVRTAQARPTNSRSDAPANRRSAQSSLERRLENIEL